MLNFRRSNVIKLWKNNFDIKRLHYTSLQDHLFSYLFIFVHVLDCGMGSNYVTKKNIQYFFHVKPVKDLQKMTDVIY